MSSASASEHRRSSSSWDCLAVVTNRRLFLQSGSLPDDVFSSSMSRPRGVDVGTKAEIYALMRELAREGLAILVISSDLPKVLTISDRILVMRAGRLAGEISFDEASEERIMALAALEHGHATGM